MNAWSNKIKVAGYQRTSLGRLMLDLNLVFVFKHVYIVSKLKYMTYVKPLIL